MNSTVKSVCEEFSKGNPNFGSEFLADDVRWHLVGKQVAVGIEDVMRLSDSGPDLGFPTFTLSKIISDGNHLVIQGSGVSKDGADERLHEFCDIFLIKEDKIAEITSYLITSAK